MKISYHGHRFPSFQQFFLGSFLWCQNISSLSQYFFLWTTNLQIVMISLWIQLAILIKTSTNDIFSYFIYKFSDIFTMNGLATYNLNFDVLIVVVWAYIIGFLIIIAIIIIKFRLKQNLSRAQNYFIVVLGQLHLSLIFWIINIILINDLSSSIVINNFVINDKSRRIVNLIFTTINFIVTLFISVFSYDPFRGSNIMSTHTPLSQIFTFFAKTSLALLIRVDSSSGFGMYLFGTLSFLVLAIRHYHLMRTFPYYHYLPQRISIAMSSITLFVSSCTFFAIVLRNSIEITGFSLVYIEVLLVPMVVKYFDLYLQRVIDSFLVKNDAKINTEADAIKTLFSLNYFIKKTPLSRMRHTNPYELQLSGKIYSYLEGKDFLDSFQVQFNAGEYTVGSPIAHDDQQSDMMNNIMHKVLSTFVKRLPNSRKVKFISANHIVIKNSNLAVAVNLLVEISKQREFLGPAAIKLLGDIETILHRSFKNEEDGVLDIKTFLDFDAVSMDFVKIIYTNTDKFIEFWDLYRKPKFELIELLKKSTIIENDDKKVKTIWNQHIQKQKLYASTLDDFYGIYLMLVRNARFSAQKLKEKYQLLNCKYKQQGSLLSSENLISPDNITLTVSMSKSQIGKVIHVSSNITRFLGWTENDLLGKNMDIMLIPFFREKHTQIMIHHIETSSKKSRLNHRFESFVFTKDNRILPCSVYVSIHPYIQEELRYTAIIRIKETNQDILILNQNGEIECCTRNIGEELKLSKNRRTHLLEICGYAQEYGTKDGYGLTYVNDHYQSESNSNKNFSVPSILIQNDKEIVKTSFLYGNNFWANIQALKNKEELLIALGKIDFNKKLVQQDLKKYLASLKEDKIGDLSFYVLSLEISDDIGSNRDSIERIDFQYELKKENDTVSIIDIPNEKSVLFETNIETNTKFELENTEQAVLRTHVPLVRDRERSRNHFVSKKTINNKTKTDNDFTQADKNTSKKKVEIVRKLEVNIAASVGSSNKTCSNAKIEEAVYMIPKHSNLRILNLLVVLLIVLTAALLIFFESRNSKTIAVVGNLITLISASSMQLLDLVEYNRIAKIVSLYDLHPDAVNRFTWANIPDVRFVSRIRFPVQNENLARYDNIIRDSLYIFDKTTQQMFFKKLPVIDWDPITKISSVRESNPFNLVTEIIISGQKILSEPYQNLKNTSHDLAFILNNTIGDILVTGQNFVNIVLQDTQSRMTKLSNLLFIFISVTGVVSFLFISFLLSVERKLVLDRNRLLEIFLKFDEKEIQKRLDMVIKFRSALDKNNMDGRNFRFDIDDDRKNYQAVPKAKELSSSIYQRKVASRKNINQNLIKITIKSLFLVVILLVGYTVVMLVLQSQNNAITTKIEMLVDSNFNFYEFTVLIDATYEYILTNTTATLRGHPIDEEWKQTFKKVAELQEKLIKVTDSERGLGGNDQLVQIIKGNLCEILISDPYAGAQCASLIYGFVGKGIIQMNSFILSLLQRTKQSFDSSSKTMLDMFAVLSTKDFIESEPAWTLYMLPGYQLIDQLIREQLTKDLNTYSQAITLILSFFEGTYLVVGLLLWWSIKTTFDKERIRWRKMLRLVPDTIVASNKMLKGYLMLNINHVLS